VGIGGIVGVDEYPRLIRVVDSPEVGLNTHSHTNVEVVTPSLLTIVRVGYLMRQAGARVPPDGDSSPDKQRKRLCKLGSLTQRALAIELRVAGSRGYDCLEASSIRSHRSS
jgi:hypothetical protein